MRALVVGGAGYIGSVLCRHLLDAGDQVTVYDRFVYGDGSLDRRAGVIRGDVRDMPQLHAAIKRCDIVYYLAELVGDPICGKFPSEAFETNELASICAVRMARHRGVPRFVYASSCSVYGASADPDALLDEASPLAPQSSYARYKIQVEREILANPSGFRIVRLGTVFGLSQRMRFDLVVNRLTAHAVTDRKLRVFGGWQWRPHTHVSDVAAALRFVGLLGASHDGGVFNVVGDNLTISGLARLIAGEIGDVDVAEEGDGGDKRNYRVSGALLSAAGFTTSTSLQRGVREIRDAIKLGQLRHYSDACYHNVDWYRGDGHSGGRT